MRIRPPPDLVHRVGQALTRSLRFRVDGVDHLRAALRASPTGSVIFVLWHQHLLQVVGKHRHQRIAALASLSNDGTIMADYIERLGLRAIRGSSSRGGLKAARELIAAITEGWHAAITVDGPRGPYKEVKVGPFEIARRSGAPIVPVVARASREACFKRAWDRFRAPLPGARVQLLYGEPIVVSPTYPSPDEALALRVDLAHRLHDLEAEAARRVGRRDGGPIPSCLAWMRRS